MRGFDRCLRDLAGMLRRVRLLLLVATVVAIAGSAAAQDLTPDERTQLEARKAALFQEMLRNPANLDATFAYAETAARLGDNEAAVSAFERMLLFNPNLPRVELELGTLYFRMGSFEIARSYFEKALASNPSPEVRSRIDEYLAEIARRAAPERLIGYVFFGAQYQSDANVAPGSALIHSPIGDVLLGNQFVKKADVNLFGTVSALYSYDLGTQNRDMLEIGGTAFLNHYFQVGRLDLALAEVTAGPRLNFPEPLPGVRTGSLKPYLILNEVGLGGNQYFYTYGAGLEETALVIGDARLRTNVEFRQKSFSNASDRPLSTGLNGNDKLVALRLDKPLTVNSELGLEFDFLDQQTRFAFYSNKAYAVGGAYRVRYQDPTGYLELPWETSFYLGRVWANYAAPDPCCNTSGNPDVFAASKRNDRRWRFGITQAFRVAGDVAIVLQVQRDIVSSNLSLYAYTSNSVLVGPQIRF
ncbi:MAG TPA: tetratricopeptide repeat protein [Stellaceae bacterium]|nr:tetratricopeptide repeat protein [Stellaceae bacterium]